ncbi:hypothetical protein G2W53_019525 [Senna tora]|uniref:Uncharacterized protein n=1 Tax=Senna tora TaxID=362788 RepID=A0A834TX39_9FABA|nr:hypothetical protein G2W53_019525 [Senna tora]
MVTEPSGPYFLGRPLFFFTGIVMAAGAAPIVAVCGGGTLPGGAAADDGVGVVDPPVAAGFSVLGATW